MPRPQERPLKVNTKKLTRAQHKMECMGELTAFFSCMTVCCYLLTVSLQIMALQ